MFEMNAQVLADVWSGKIKPDMKLFGHGSTSGGSGVDLAPPKIYQKNGGPTLATLPTSQQKWLLELIKYRGLALLQGPAGTGKSWMAWAAIHAAVLAGKRCAYYLFWNIPADIEDTRDYELKSDALHRWNWTWKVDFLVIDEFFGAKLSAREYAEVRSWVEYRHENELPTLFISNQSDSELMETAGSPILSRIAGNKLVLNNSDRRK
jgi:DNA replication protein DnaC